MRQVASNSACQEHYSGIKSLSLRFSMSTHWEMEVWALKTTEKGEKKTHKRGFLLLAWAMCVGVGSCQVRIKWCSRQTKGNQDRGGWTCSSPPPKIKKTPFPRMLPVPVPLAHFVARWRQMVLPRAASLISHHHLGTARKWSRAHPSLIKCCNGTRRKLPVLSGPNTHTHRWKLTARTTPGRGRAGQEPLCICVHSSDPGTV